MEQHRESYRGCFIISSRHCREWGWPTGKHLCVINKKGNAQSNDQTDQRLDGASGRTRPTVEVAGEQNTRLAEKDGIGDEW